MKIEVEVISKEIIKPSFPTRHRLRCHRLSFLDQLAPNAYVPFVYFYESTATATAAQISETLKASLSQALTQYYPLAGRVKDNLFVHCNDEGIPFFEAKLKSQLLSDVIHNPCLSELNKLVPFKLDEITEIALGIQVNVFDCGGIAIGLCVSHRLADGMSCFKFMDYWAATARGKNMKVGPDFSAASIFPPKNMDGYLGVSITNKKAILTKRFVLDGLKVESLRSKYEEKMNFLKTQKRPSRVEALAAFFWDIFMSSRTTQPTQAQTLYTVVYIMDLRSRFRPPLPQHTFGNYYRAATGAPCLPSAKDYGGLVRKVMEEIDGIDNGYMRKFQEGYKEHLDFMRKRMERAAKGELVTLTFSSLCKFPIYEVDFGWGEPSWVSMAAMQINNQIVFMDTKNRDGIEVYFSLKEEDMAKFEADEEFIKLLSSPNGNVKENLLARL